MCSILSDIFDEHDIDFILQLDTVQFAKQQPSHIFQIELPIHMQQQLKEKLGIQPSTIPMKWIKGNTSPHIDKSMCPFQQTHLIYMTDSDGYFMINNQSYPIKKNTAFSFPEGIEHETINTGSIPRLLMGPMSELGIPVGVSSSFSYPGQTIIYIRQYLSEVQSSTDLDNWYSINFPATITNTDTSLGILKIIFTTNITISNIYQYFECLSSHIQIGSTSLNSDGSRPVITIDSVSDYPGLIKNGTGISSGYNYIYVFNLNVSSNNSTLYSSETEGGGWIGQSYFGTQSTYNYIINCSSNGAISSYGGGIVGSYAGYSSSIYMNIIGCSSTGTINSHAGGIVGYNSDNTKINSCWSTGEILSNAGGIGGANCNNININSCYTTGSISGEGAGGICGTNCGLSITVYIESSYTTGNIRGIHSGGITGSYSNNVYITNCYTGGTVGDGIGGIGIGGICGLCNESNQIYIQNCYIYGSDSRDYGYVDSPYYGNDLNHYAAYSINNCYAEQLYANEGIWIKVNAINVLIGTPTSPSIIGDKWIETTTDSAFELYNIGYSPFDIENISFNGFIGSLNKSYPIIGNIPTKDMTNISYDTSITPYNYQSQLFPDLSDFTTDNIVQGDKTDENKYMASYWHQFGNYIFDNWGYFYIYDVTTSKYYFPLLSLENQSNGLINTQIFNAFDRIFTINHGWTIQGVFKIDISVDDSLPFRFGAYGNMGSDSSTIYGNLTNTYTLNDESKTLYYSFNSDTNNSNENLYYYVIPYNDSDNTEQPYSVYYTDLSLECYMSLYTNSITSGVTIYFSNVNDSKSYIIDQIKLSNGDTISNTYLLMRSESTSSAIISGQSYEILQKMLYDEDSNSYILVEDDTITINSITGSISTTLSTIPGTYKIYIRNTGSYHISEYTLIIPDIIYASGSSDIVYIKYDSTIQYKINDGSYFTPSFPIKICNTNTSSLLKVLFETDITISDVSCYFKCETSHIQFGSASLNSDGSRPIITIDSVSDYPGLIQNGTSDITGCNYIYIFNLKIISNSSSLASNAGWVAQTYFGNGSTYNHIGNCHSTGEIPSDCGGIMGSYSGNNGSVNLLHCSSIGDIGSNSGGIAGPYTGNSGIISCEECWSEGSISEYGGGIYGQYSGYNGSIIATKCYTSGSILDGAGGIFSQNTVSSSGSASASHCYTTGSIGAFAGGIISSYIGSGGTVTIDNCFSVGIIAENGGGIKGIYDTDNVSITNCYAANGVWNKVDANSNLSGVPSNTVLGTIFSESHSGEHYRIHSHGHTPYSTEIISLTNYIPSMIKTYSQTITSGESTNVGLVSGEYRILYSQTITSSIAKTNHSTSSPAISCDLTSGSIRSSLSYTTSINLTIYNTGSYHISTFILTIEPASSVPICFPAGTPVLTDQGEIAIHKLDPKKHTIRNQPIIAITKTVPLYEYIICIKKDSLGVNLPNRHTFISKDHKVLYMNKLVPAETLPGAIKVKYSNQILYNVLLKDYSTMSVNQLTVETLHPENTLAKLYAGKYTDEQKRKFILHSNKFNLQQRKSQVIKSNFLNVLYK